MKKTPAKLSFKAYEQHQSQQFPSSLDEWIPENHLVRLINTVIDKMEPEAVFGQINANRQFRRFLLRGLDKVTVEFGLVAIAHNLMKLWMKRVAKSELTAFSGSTRPILGVKS